jgi:PEP-CTERM motif
MTTLIKKALISASVVAGMSAIASAPASAFTMTGNDYLLYDVTGNSTYVNQNANLNNILGGNSASPGGNVELFATSETLNNAQYLASTARTSVSGLVGGSMLTLSSLTAADWFSTGSSMSLSYGANNLANRWFNDFLTAAGQGSANSLVKAVAFNTFFGIGGFQRSSDPNISYINTSGSDINIGLAGHFDLKAFYTRPGSPFAGFANLLPNGFQASEVVRSDYNGLTNYLYSFSATQTGLTNSVGAGADNLSHSGNYQVSLRGVVTPPPTAVPEPSAMLALFGLGGLLVTKRKRSTTA